MDAPGQDNLDVLEMLQVLIPLVIMAIVIALFANFRFLLYPLNSNLNPVTTAKKYELTGNTLFISDLHLRSSAMFPFAQELRSCIEVGQISNLVIDGDLFDSPEDAERILETESSDKVGFLGLSDIPLRTYWIIGSPLHDPRNPNTNITIPGNCAIFMCGGMSIVAYHGHDLSMKGGIAHAIDRFISPLIVEKMWKRFAGIDARSWVIFGHTHIPGLDPKALVANCGAWATYRLVRPTGTGIELNSDLQILRLITIANLST